MHIYNHMWDNWVLLCDCDDERVNKVNFVESVKYIPIAQMCRALCTKDNFGIGEKHVTKIGQ